MTVVLVIGYGNELRGDDGIGPRVAEAVAELRLPGVEALAVHQLTPELADRLPGVQMVIFVDAAESGSFEVQPLDPATGFGSIDHTSQPRSILSLAQAIHGASPETWFIRVPGACFDFGTSLSTKAEQGVREAVAVIAQILQDHAKTPPPSALEKPPNFLGKHNSIPL
jgi:hydrogenase maturation protease